MSTKERLSKASKKFSAFTLAELIVVITILAILATVGFLALSGYTQDAKDASVKTNLRSVYSAISSESAVTNNSPRYYVVHETGAALADGTVAFVDGSPVALTGGAYGAVNTNYSAGNPDWAKLKLNPDKFKLSSLSARFVATFGTAQAAYDSKLVSVWAVDTTLAPTANGRSRSASFFQVAWTAPATKIVSVVGNFPSPTAAQVTLSGATAGLVKSPSSTGALVEGGTSGGLSGGNQSFSCTAVTIWDSCWTVIAGGVSYETKCMADAKCWTFGSPMSHAASAGTTYNGGNSGKLYDFPAAWTLCSQLWAGWVLPSHDAFVGLETALWCNNAATDTALTRCAALGAWMSAPAGNLGGLFPTTWFYGAYYWSALRDTDRTSFWTSTETDALNAKIREVRIQAWWGPLIWTREKVDGRSVVCLKNL